jgi:hypothetical protein
MATKKRAPRTNRDQFLVTGFDDKLRKKLDDICLWAAIESRSQMVRILIDAMHKDLKAEGSLKGVSK